MTNTAIATTTAAIMVTQATHNLGRSPEAGRVSHGGLPHHGKPSAGQIVSQTRHVRIAASDPIGLSIPAQRDCG
jgi:hypothetical protein